jgi:RNA polymerase sigma-70 factor (ECF subfamily)
MPIPPRPDVEERIAALLAKGDFHGAVSVAITEYGAEIQGYITAIVHDEDRASDAFSDFAEDLWRGVKSFRSESTFRSWAYRVAWNAAMDELNDAYRRRGQRLQTREVSELVAAVRSSTADFLKPEASRAFEQLRARLTPAERSLLTLRIDRKLSWRELCVVQSENGEQIEEATARKRWERLLRKLRRLKDDE